MRRGMLLDPFGFGFAERCIGKQPQFFHWHVCTRHSQQKCIGRPLGP